MISPAELAAWLRLAGTPGIGRIGARRLLAAFGSPQAVFEADPGAQRRIVGPDAADALSAPPEGWAAQVDTTVQWLAAAGPPRDIVTLGDTRYPDALLESPDPPLWLHAEGRLELLGAQALAIVGSRNPTPQGRDNARHFAAALSQSGFTIVSGLALGIDGAAHEGALEGAGATIAVVATGLDRVYPGRHLALAHRIAEHGLLVSEHFLETPPLPAHFPQRNRIIAGLARGTLVVEAALPSGSLITARLANEAGREVFAIPGSIHSPQARGCHWLLKQGAKLVETAEDVLEELNPDWMRAHTSARPSADGAADLPDGLLSALGFDPVSVDALCARTGQPVAELQSRLLVLELEGRVARLPGQLYQRVPSG